MVLRVAFAGTPPFSVSALRALLGAPDSFRVCGALTAPDRRAGRGRKLQGSAVKALALEHGLPLLQPPKIDGETVAQVAAWDADVLVVSAYGLLLPPALLATPPLGCVNIHASLLPRWRGAAPIERCIEAGDAATGVSIMAMDEGCDTGAVFHTVPYALRPTDTLGSVTEELAALGAEALLGALPAIASGELSAAPQDEAGATYARKVLKSHAALDFSKSAAELERAVRAFNPRPVAHSWLEAEGCGGGDPLYVRVWEAAEGGSGHGGASGEVVSVGGAGMEVATGCGGRYSETMVVTAMCFPGAVLTACLCVAA